MNLITTWKVIQKQKYDGEKHTHARHYSYLTTKFT